LSHLLCFSRSPSPFISSSSLFSHCSGYLLDLLSFPTRRSSDLRSIVCVPGASMQARAIQALRSVSPTPTMPSSESVRRISTPGSDRKSTRLNSSHQIISYAVFCLKKKKKRQNTLYVRHNQHETG